MGCGFIIVNLNLKQPQLDLAVIGPDGVALEHPRPPQRTTPKVPVMLPENPFTTYAAASSVRYLFMVTESW